MSESILTVTILNEATEADNDLWEEYKTTVPPDDQSFLLYHEWLALKLKTLRVKHPMYDRI
jgi:hypothetical protein